MRRMLIAGGLFGLVAALGTVRADRTPVPGAHPVPTLDDGSGPLRQVHIHRWLFGLAGHDVDVAHVCDGRAARAVSYGLRSQDVAAALITAGWYTPETVLVRCPAQ
jgi:hypothetical protein